MKSSLEKRQTKKGKKKRKKGGGEGGTEEEDEEAESQPELTLKEEQAKLEQEKEAIMKNQALLEEVFVCMVVIGIDRMHSWNVCTSSGEAETVGRSSSKSRAHQEGAEEKRWTGIKDQGAQTACAFQ